MIPRTMLKINRNSQFLQIIKNSLRKLENPSSFTASYLLLLLDICKTKHPIITNE